MHPPAPFLIAAFVGFNCWQAVRSEHAKADPARFVVWVSGRIGLSEGPWGAALSSCGLSSASSRTYSPALCCSPTLPTVLSRGRQELLDPELA